MSATIIGEVAVKVRPDTDGFRGETQRELTAVEKLLNDVRIGFEADIDEAVRETREAVERAQSSVRDSIKIRLDLENQDEVKQGIRALNRELDKLKDRTELTVELNHDDLTAGIQLLEEQLADIAHIDIDVELGNESSMKRAISKIDHELDKIRETTMKVDLDEHSLVIAREQMQHMLDGMAADAARIKLDIDNKAFRAVRAKVADALAGIHWSPELDDAGRRKLETQLDALYHQLEEKKLELGLTISEREKHHVQSEIDKLEGEIAVKVGEASLRTVQARLGILARTRFADIVPTVNKAAAAKAAATLAALSGGRAFKGLATDFTDWLGNLDRAVPKIASVSLALGNLVSLAGSATSNLFAFGGSLATIGGAGLALPGILGGMALGVIAFGVAIKDFNKYVPDFAVGMGRTLKAGEAWKQLQDSMSNNFWKNAAAPIRELISVLFPQFSAGMNRVSTELGKFTGNLATSLTGTLGKQMTSMFHDLEKSITITADHTNAFAGIITKLGRVGAGNLPRLAGWFGNLADTFNHWLKEKGRSGLQQFVDTGIQALKDLGGLISATSSTLAGLYRAAEKAGGSTVQVMRDTMERVSKTVNSASFQRDLTNVFAAAHDGISEIVNGSGKQFRSFIERLAHTLDTVLPSAGRAAGTALGAIFGALDQPKVQSSIEGLFKNIERSVSNLAPAMKPTADALASIVDVVGQLGVNLSRSLAPALEIIGPAISGLADDLKPLIDQLGNLLTHAVEGASPVLADLAETLGDLAGSLAEILKPINAIADAFGALPDPIKGTISQLAAIGILVGGAMWLGAGVRSKIGQFGASITLAGQQAGVAQGLFFKAGSAAQGITSRMTGTRLGLLGAAGAVGTLGDKSTNTGKALGILGDTATGAVIGSAFGPGWGTAIGAAGGALYGLYKATTKSSDGMKVASHSADDFAASLNQITGASTEATRAMAYDDLKTNGVLDAMEHYGISARTVVDGVMGQVSARKQLTAAIAAEKAEGEGYLSTAQAMLNASQGYESMSRADQDYYDSLIKQGDQLTKNADNLSNEIGLSEKSVAATRAKALAVTEYGKVLAGLPKALIAQVKVDGLDGSMKQVRSLAKQYNLTPKKIRTLVQAEGLDLTERQIKNLIKSLKDADRQRPKPKFEVDTKSAHQTTNKFMSEIRGVDRVVGKAKVTAEDKATKIIEGAKVKLAAWGNASASAHADLVNNASPKIASVRTELDQLNGKTATTYIKTVRLGGGGGGGGGGLDGNGRIAAKAGDQDSKDYIDALQKSIQKYLAKSRAKFQANWDAMFKKFDTKEQRKKLRAMFDDDKAYFNQLSGQVERLSKALDGAQQRLQTAKDNLENYRLQLVGAINETGNPVNAGAKTYDGIVKAMAKAVARAQEWSQVMSQLQGKLNDTTYQQLLAAGPDAGLEIAKAIMAGGVSQINLLQQQLDAAAQATAGSASQHLFGGAVADAQQDVDQLLTQLKPLQKKLRQFAHDLIAALRDQLAKESVSVGLGVVEGNPGNPKPGKHHKPGNGGKKFAASVPSSVTDAGGSYAGIKVINYYAAENKSFDSQDELFTALDRAGGW